MQNILLKRNVSTEEDLSVILGKYIPITSFPINPVNDTPEKAGFSTFSLYDYDYAYKSALMEKNLRNDIFKVKKILLRIKNFFIRAKQN